MRIRRCASKLLDFASAPASASVCVPCPQSQAWTAPPSQPPAWDAGAPSSLVLCKLNRSPWDFIDDLELDNPQDEEEESKGFVGGRIKVIEEEASLPPIHRSKPKAKKTKGKEEHGSHKHQVEEGEKKTRKKERAMQPGGEAGAKGVAVSCKKTDGKGWHCKRLAHQPHSLCHYHLAQIRSYSTSYAHGRSVVAAAGVEPAARKRKASPAEADGTDTNLFYYYSGFGPWRGKRRGGSSRDTHGGADDQGNAEERQDNSESREDDDHAPVAGGDEESNSTDDRASCSGGHDASANDRRDVDKRRRYRKRGRKPVKARSLKSLL